MIFMPVTQLEDGIWAMREVYADARNFNNIKATLDALLKEGFPKELYDRYLKEAEELGFFDNGFTAEEILSKPKPPFDFYGFGP